MTKKKVKKRKKKLELATLHLIKTCFTFTKWGQWCLKLTGDVTMGLDDQQEQSIKRVFEILHPPE
jgi:hypothetical protein